jgi:hypothetical protein
MASHDPSLLVFFLPPKIFGGFSEKKLGEFWIFPPIKSINSYLLKFWESLPNF